MSAPRPSTWMPFYVGDYLRDTQHLDAEKHGAYVLLILSYWVSGQPLPDDDEHLATVARLSLKRWKQIRPVIARFFGVENNEWRHKRVDIELAKAQQITNKRAAAGRASAQHRASKPPTHVGTHVEQVYQQTDQQTGEQTPQQTVRPSQSPSPSQEEKDSPPKPPRKRGVNVDTPEFSSFWEAFPNKVGKGHARKAFSGALAKTDLAALLEAVQRYKRSKPPDQKWCNPSTFLNGERWLDEPAKANGHSSHNTVSEYRGPQGPPPAAPEGWLESGEGVH
jgi:uncharacterized protein YdaU (DUF1376 family)